MCCEKARSRRVVTNSALGCAQLTERVTEQRELKVPEQQRLPEHIKVLQQLDCERRYLFSYQKVDRGRSLAIIQGHV